MRYTGYAATMQGVWFSHDDGVSWNRLPTPTGGMYNEARCWSLAVHPRCPGELLAGTDQGLYRYTDDTQRFDYIPSPMDDLHILQVARHPKQPEFIVCGTRPAEIFVSEDNGKSWKRSNLNAGTECWFINTCRVTSIHFDSRDADTIWITIEIDGVFRSSDRGRTWTHLSEGLVDRDTHDLVFLERNDGSRTILCSTEAGLHQSADNGDSWTRLPVPEEIAPWPYWRSIKSRADDKGVVLASVGDKPSGEAGVLLISRDFGQTWDRAQLSHPVNSTIWSIAVNSADPELLFFATIFGQIYRSRDGGASWEKMKRELGEIRAIAWAPAAR
jgi:photosystem II stability/assembly factor-like uncharacterized protein